jgi:hypothetical protein
VAFLTACLSLTIAKQGRASARLFSGVIFGVLGALLHQSAPELQFAHMHNAARWQDDMDVVG